jgi:outer membrane protein OmpA-like peptidoglycan-associated protein
MKILTGLVAACIASSSVALAQDVFFPPVTDKPEVQVVPLEINTNDDDFAPVALMGERAIAFTTSREGDQRIYMASRGTAGWSAPVSAGDALTHAEEIGTTALTPDGNYMIFAAFEWDATRPDETGYGRTDLYSAEKVGGQWTNIRNLGAVINSSGWDSQPSLSSDGRMLFFASDRPGGMGGTDIYVSIRSASGWGAPTSLGQPVNTPADDMAPTIAPDGRRLFFSSEGHGGAGGFDLFNVSNPDARGRGWSSIENLGTPINSAADEYFYVSIPNSKNAYFSTSRSGNLDIYTAYPNPFPPEALVTVSGVVTETGTGIKLAANITVTDLASGEVVATFRTDSDNGEYFVVLKKGGRYSITAEAPDHIFYSDEYAVPPNTEGKDLKKDIDLFRTTGGTTRLLVFFDYNKTELKTESKPDLNRAIEFLKANPNVRIEIAGHTDDKGDDAYNKRLSQTRAESVRSYFMNGGIDASRLTATGYGEEQPVADNGTEEGRARNRRVELRVTQ